MSATLLQLTQTFCMRTGLPAPVFVVGNTDAQIGQILALLSETLEDLRTNFWEILRQEAVFASQAGTDQGELDVLAPGFQRMVPDTFYNRANRLKIPGPLSPQQWQAMVTMPSTGPMYQYRIMEGHLHVYPPAIGGETFAFEYISDHCVLDADSGDSKPFPTKDSDTFRIKDDLLLAGLRWKWKYEKGLEYGEDFRRYSELAVLAAGRDGSKPALSMEGAEFAPRPGILVPPGSWNLP